jgi:hypothetical protein
MNLSSWSRGSGPSLLSVALSGPAELPLLNGEALPDPGLLCVAYLDSDEDDDDEELALRSSLTSSKSVVSGSVRDTFVVRHDEPAATEPCDDLSVVAVVGGEADWI